MLRLGEINHALTQFVGTKKNTLQSQGIVGSRKELTIINRLMLIIRICPHHWLIVLQEIFINQTIF
jgi:hypothetical protein